MAPMVGTEVIEDTVVSSLVEQKKEGTLWVLPAPFTTQGTPPKLQGAVRVRRHIWAQSAVSLGEAYPLCT